MAKPVFGALLIWGHRNIEPGRLGSKSSSCLFSILRSPLAVHIRDYEDAPYSQANIEKSNGHSNNPDSAVTSGAAV